jgi:hypothetical protein
MYQTLISSVTVGAGGATSISFNSIPGTFTDLVLVYCGANTAAITFNGDTAGNYSQRWLRGTGASVQVQSSSGNTWGVQIGAQSNTADIINSAALIPNYTGSTAKMVSVDFVGESNNATTFQYILAGQWTGTAAITSITINWFGTTYPQHTTAYLYGTLKGAGGATVS